MDTDKPLVNRVAESGIVTLNLETYYPAEPIAVFDLKNYLFHGLILKEKDFRQAVQEHDWAQYTNQMLAVHCSSDAIIPMWAYQLVAIAAAPFAKRVAYGNVETLLTIYYIETLNRIDWNEYKDQRVVVKGCSDKPVPPSAYTEVARLLQPVAKSIMYGEPCSTVPLFKRK